MAKKRRKQGRPLRNIVARVRSVVRQAVDQVSRSQSPEASITWRRLQAMDTELTGMGRGWTNARGKKRK